MGKRITNKSRIDIELPPFNAKPGEVMDVPVRVNGKPYTLKNVSINLTPSGIDLSINASVLDMPDVEWEWKFE